MKRRQFIGLFGASALGLVLPELALGEDRRRSSGSTTTTTTASSSLVPTDTGSVGSVVIVGGGMAGATAAKFLRLWGGSNVQVTLVDQNATYSSNIMSNLVLNGSTTMSQLTYNYNTLTSAYGVKFVQGSVVGVVPPVGSTAGSVRLADGRVLFGTKIILAPGIEFDDVPGLTPALQENYVPHAWRAGAQTTKLASQIRNMRAGGTFIMTIPASPYRCPPGPYERACVVADYLKRNKPGSRVIVLDANPFIQAERTNFERAFNVTHAGVIDYRPGQSLTGVTVSITGGKHAVTTSSGTEYADVLNVIPSHRAGKIITDNPVLANVGGRWAGVDVRSYESTSVPNVYVIGDSASSGQPKAGHIANQEAKLCADAIARALRGDLTPNPAPKTNSACYSPITADTASWLTVVYGYDAVNKKMVAVPGAGPIEAAAATQDNFNDMKKWFATLMSDSFA
ncbi:MAG: NAD(P)/FAD-dependent oxidoreductase [Sulfuricella denitrificans]|nr:NAD(P)/FAD-dependent oxidoreductase [Sulfuricella denitrificans]